MLCRFILKTRENTNMKGLGGTSWLYPAGYKYRTSCAPPRAQQIVMLQTQTIRKWRWVGARTFMKPGKNITQEILQWESGIHRKRDKGEATQNDIKQWICWEEMLCSEQGWLGIVRVWLILCQGWATWKKRDGWKLLARGPYGTLQRVRGIGKQRWLEITCSWPIPCQGWGALWINGENLGTDWYMPPRYF